MSQECLRKDTRTVRHDFKNGNCAEAILPTQTAVRMVTGGGRKVGNEIDEARTFWEAARTMYLGRSLVVA